MWLACEKLSPAKHTRVPSRACKYCNMLYVHVCVDSVAWGRQSSPKNLYNSANSEWFCRLHKTFFPKIRKPFMPEPFFCLCLPKALPQVEIGCGFHTLWDIPVTTKVIYARFKFHSSRICSISFGFHSTLREIVSNFQESGDRSKTSTFFFAPRPFWWTLFKNNIQKFQQVFILAKIRKFEIGQNLPNLHISIMPSVHFHNARSRQQKIVLDSFFHKLFFIPWNSFPTILHL